MSKNHNIHHIIGCAAALFVGTQGNSAMADYGYGSLDELKAYWREKPNAIPETFNRLWFENTDSFLWQDAQKYRAGHRFRVHRYGQYFHLMEYGNLVVSRKNSEERKP